MELAHHPAFAGDVSWPFGWCDPGSVSESRSTHRCCWSFWVRCRPRWCCTRATGRA